MNQRIADAFLEGTKYQNLESSNQQQGIEQPPSVRDIAAREAPASPRTTGPRIRRDESRLCDSDETQPQNLQ